MKQFKVTFIVTGCVNCPYSTKEHWCSANKELHTAQEFALNWMLNERQITESCPMYKQAEDVRHT